MAVGPPNFDFENQSIPVSHNAICARMKSIHVSETNLAAFYEIAAKYWDDPTFLSEIAIETHILFFDLDIYVDADVIWNSSRTLSTVVFIANKVHISIIIVYGNDSCIIVYLHNNRW